MFIPARMVHSIQYYIHTVTLPLVIHSIHIMHNYRDCKAETKLSYGFCAWKQLHGWSDKCRKGNENYRTEGWRIFSLFSFVYNNANQSIAAKKIIHRLQRNRQIKNNEKQSTIVFDDISSVQEAN